MKHFTLVVFLFFFVLSLIGCSGKTHITSQPKGADVYLNDEYIGKTPMSITVPDTVGKFGDTMHIVKANKKGYQDQEKIFKDGAWDATQFIIPAEIHFDLETLHAESPVYQPATKIPTFSPANNTNSKNISWAIVIGISKYQYTGQNGLTNLIFADDDAKAFANSLRNLGWSESHIKLLTNEEATQRNVMIALKSWLTKAGPDDQVVLFWAGHGYADPEDPEKVYLATYDTDISIPATGYRMDEVRKALEEIRAKNVVLLADTCHAGKLITRGNGNRGISIVPNIKEQNVPKGWVFMVGADTDRQAIEHTSWSNGAFTHSLIKGLDGEADGFQSAGAKDGVVTMGELKDYMKTSMPDETQKVLGVAKHPVITTSSGDPDIWNLTLQVQQ